MPKLIEPVWTDINLRRPNEYELCKLLTSEGKVRIGWRTGLHYDGVKLKTGEQVVMWMRHSEHHREDSKTL